MKTVIVFDTDDREGMKNTVEIIDHLSQVYLSKSARMHEKSFGKIRFIKLLREFARTSQKEGVDGASLRIAKRFSDKVWNEEV
tara:strand:+ start:470 stop:718 length:249 start_codon:yes stop_codon:yes gene_type:complete